MIIWIDCPSSDEWANDRRVLGLFWGEFCVLGLYFAVSPRWWGCGVLILNWIIGLAKAEED